MITIGSKIRDIEDSDCYYEGIVVSLNPLMYKITAVLWNNELCTELNGNVTQQKWWKIEVVTNSDTPP